MLSNFNKQCCTGHQFLQENLERKIDKDFIIFIFKWRKSHIVEGGGMSLTLILLVLTQMTPQKDLKICMGSFAVLWFTTIDMSTAQSRTSANTIGTKSAFWELQSLGHSLSVKPILKIFSRSMVRLRRWSLSKATPNSFHKILKIKNRTLLLMWSIQIIFLLSLLSKFSTQHPKRRGLFAPSFVVRVPPQGRIKQAASLCYLCLTRRTWSSRWKMYKNFNFRIMSSAQWREIINTLERSV